MLLNKAYLGCLLSLCSPFTSADQDAAYKSCTVPSFEWATYSSSSTARMHVRQASVSEKFLYAAGYLKSTIDPSIEGSVLSSSDFTLTGPYSVSDPSGDDAKTIDIDLVSYPASQGYKENAGGSFGQYEVGVVKINKTTGKPIDIFVYPGHGYEETTGFVEKNNMLVMSGHFAGNLTTIMQDGTTKTIWNSNVPEGTLPNLDDQFHPNNRDASGHTGVDDGFVIKASAETGKAKWVSHYPQSNRDSSVVAVDLDEEGNVYGAGHKCMLLDGAEAKVCEGTIIKFDKDDGTIIWEKVFPDLGSALRITYDSEDCSVYFTGTTTYGGSTKDTKSHASCDHDTCSVVGRLNCKDASVDWIRTIAGSPRWGSSGLNGGVEIASSNDGPYIYAAIDDTGDEVKSSLNAGTSYAGCKDGDGIITPEFEISQSKVIGADDCSENTVFVGREDEDALLASSVESDVYCGKLPESPSCLMKYHKYTGLPIWAEDVPPVAGLVPSTDGESVMIAGHYFAAQFGSVELPGYVREGGLATQTSGIYNTKLSSVDGTGSYALHSGGGAGDRLYDVVGDDEGNIYNVGYSMNLVMNWGNNLITEFSELDIDPNDVGTQAKETHFYASKLIAGVETQHSCLSSCTNDWSSAVIEDNSCFIDGRCYSKGQDGTSFGLSCFECNPEVSQTEWSQSSSIGVSQCYVDGVCVNTDDFKFYQRRTWGEKIFSKCQVCNPSENAFGWTVKEGYGAIEGASPPNDCTANFPTSSPTNLPTTQPTTLPSKLFLHGKYSIKKSCKKVKKKGICTGDCSFVKLRGNEKCNVRSDTSCDCVCETKDDDLVYPTCSSKALPFSRREKQICNPLKAFDFEKKVSTKTCSDECALSSLCASYQYDKKSKTCLLFTSADKADKSYEGSNCYVLDDDKNFKRLKNSICDPSAIIKFYHKPSSKVSTKNCQKKCLRSSDCVAYQTGDGKCFLFNERTTIEEEIEFDGVSCYTK